MSAFGPLEELRNRPIGDQAGARAARKGFRSRITISRDHALFGEVVIEARDAGLAGENFYATDRNPPYWQRVEGATDKLWLRRTRGRKTGARECARGAPGWSCFCSTPGGRARCRPISTTCGCRANCSAAIPR